MFFKCLPRMLKQANRDLNRHFSLTFSSILSIGVALLIAMLLSVMAFNIGHFTEHMESEFIIQVSISPNCMDETKEQLQTSIQALPDVESVTYSSKESELEELISENGDIFGAYRDSNPLYDTYVVRLNDSSQIDETNKKIAKMNGVLKTTYGGSIVTKMISLMGMIRKWGYAFVVVMALFALFLIRNTIKMTIQVRKDEIAIMRTVGATNWYISFPFMLEGMLTGFFGAIIPVIVCIFGYSALYESMDGVFLSDIFMLLKPFPFTIYLSLGLIGLGLLVGMLGSLMASRKYLRWTR